MKKSASPAAVLHAQALGTGTRVEEYRIERVLGQGSMGITYLAHDTHLDLQVALKEYFPVDLLVRSPDGQVSRRATDPQAVQDPALGLERFIDEARALAAFGHPNIVRVLRYFRARGTAYIVMAYEPGQSLRHWVPSHGALTLASLLAIALPLLEGLEAVHAAGFLHRDINPDTVYVRTDGTPILLDFGAALRRHGDAGPHPIVSPGFAPPEQYHPQGEQGPWTDLYALGAVMYWLVTGDLPAQAPARMTVDAMAAATQAGDAAVFGLPLLQAIDWALHPDAQRRPRRVSELRAALRGDEAALAAAAARPGAALPQPSRFSAQGQRNLLCTILFLDLVGYSGRSVDDQALIKRRLNATINRSLSPIAVDSRLAIDTGDGAALCFLGDPEEVLEAALLLRELLAQRYGASLPVRIGLHMGPVRVVADINDRVNVVGDGINMAQRIMDFALPGQVLVSRAYFDVISRIANNTARLFRPEGTHEDKHGRLHELYSVQDTRSVREAAPGYASALACAPGLPGPEMETGAGRSTRGAGAHTAHATRPLEAAVVAALEHALMQRIGPVASLLVDQALTGGGTPQQLLEVLAAHIEHPAMRDAFRQEAQRLLADRGMGPVITQPADPPPR